MMGGEETGTTGEPSDILEPVKSVSSSFSNGLNLVNSKIFFAKNFFCLNFLNPCEFHLHLTHHKVVVK